MKKRRYPKRGQSSVFCRIRDSLNEVIARNMRERNRIPRDLCRGRPADHSAPMPKTVYIPVISELQTDDACRSRGLLVMNEAVLDSLRRGGQLVAESASGERILLVKYDSGEAKNNESGM